MDRAGWIQQRRKRYLATVLTDFEKKIEPLIPKSIATREAIADFKGVTRAKMNALAIDAIDVLHLESEGMEMNAAAQDVRDRLYPSTGRP